MRYFLLSVLAAVVLRAMRAVGGGGGLERNTVKPIVANTWETSSATMVTNDMR